MSDFAGRMAGRVVRQACAMLLLWLCAAAAQAAITIVPRSFSATTPVFYTDTSVSANANIQLKCNYQAFAITSDAVPSAWARIENFGGGNLSLGGGDDGIYQLGSFTAGQTKNAFFYVCSSYTGTTVASQTYDVKVYDRKPTLPSPVTLSTASYSLTINNNIITAANSDVATIVAGPNPAVLGGVITMTVSGDGGNLGANEPFALTPSAFTAWRADAYELFATNVVFTGTNSGSFDNQLYFSTLGNGATAYVATYYFRAVTTTTSPSALSPVAFVGSPTKHTDTTKGAYAAVGGLLPIDPATNTLTLAKLVNAPTLPAQGGAVTYTLRLTNTSSYAISVDDIVDTLPATPAAATYVTNSSTFGGVAMAANPSIAGGVLTWTGPFSIPAGSFRDLVFQATLPATPGLYTNSTIAHIGTTIIDTTLTTTDNAPATAQTRVLLAPVIAKGFTPTATAVGGVLQLVITLTNPNTANALSGVAFNDAYGGTLVNSATPNAVTTCTGGTLAGGVPGGGSIGISGVSLAASASCTVTVNVTSASTTAGTNITGAVSSTNGGNGNTASAAYAFTVQPTLVKSFTPAVIAPGAVSRMSIVVTNNSASNLTNLAFSDTFPSFPSGLVVAATPNLSNTCGGMFTGATAGATAITLANGLITLPATTCQIDINVTAPVGIYLNTTSGATSNIAGTGPVSNTASLTVNLPPTVNKAFSPISISRNGTSTITITLTNPNATAITGAAFTDNYPLNLVNAVTPAAATTCSGGSVTASPNTTSPGTLTLSAATIPANGSCTVTVNVTSATAASYTNTTSVVTTANAGSSAVSNTATLTVTSAPSAVKSFLANPGAGINTMTIVITNNHTVGITGMAFSDTFPAGMTVATTPSLNMTPASCGGTATGVTSGSSLISFANGTIASAGGTCTITLSVVASSAGVYNNQTSGITSTQTGIGSPSNVAMLIAPALTKTFSPAIVGPGDTSRMTITITNPSLTTMLNGVQFNDTYPTNLRNTTTPSVINTCGGAATEAPNATNPGTLTLTAGSVPAGGTCSVSVNVSAPIGATVPTAYYNQTGTVRSNEGVGIDAADTLTVTNRPTITKSFSPATILVGQTSTMTLVIENNHNASISGLSFSDTFPTGMTVASTPAPTNTCNGTLTANANALSISLSAGSITAASPTGSCTITVAVTATPAGSFSNQTSGVISTTVSPNPGPPSNVAVLTVNLIAPTVAKSFTPSPIAVNGTSTLTVTLTNSNTSVITGVNFNDTYPPGMTTAGTPATTCGGTVTAAAAGNSLTLSGASIPANGSCTVTVSVTAAAAGSYVNTIPIGGVTATNAGSNTAAASATLNVYTPPTVTKSFTPASITSGGISVLTLTMTNPAANPGTVSGITIRDVFPTLPGAMTLANTTITTNTCGVTPTDNAGNSLAGGSVGVRLTSVSLAANTSCSVTFNVTATATGTHTNTTDAISATTAGGAALALTGTTASAALAVGTAASPNLTLTKTHTGNFVVGATHVYMLTVNNTLGTAATSGTITVTDTLPTGLTHVSATGAGWTCGAALQVVTCTSSNAIAAGLSGNPITLSVLVGATAQPSVTNTATVSGGGEPPANSGNNTASDFTTVLAAPVNSFLTDGTQTAMPGSSVLYTHQFIAGSAGSVSFSTVSTPSPVISGWSNLIYRDSNCNGIMDGVEGSTILSGGVAVAAGEQICIFVKEFVPAGAPNGAQDQITVTATFTPTLPPSTPQSYTRTDLTTVGTPGLTLTKDVRNVTAVGAFGANNTALPGQVLEYRITYTNAGTGVLTNVIINDATPAFTTYVASSAACGAPPPNLSACSATTQPAGGGTGSLVWTLTGPLAPGSQGTVTFRVTVQP